MQRRGMELAKQLQDAMDKQEDTQATIAAMRKNATVQAAAVANAKAQVVQANAERQEMQERLSDEGAQLNAEKQEVAKAQAESNLVRGLAATGRKEKQDAINRGDALAAQVATLQSTVAAAKANETKLLREEQEMQAEKKATLADSDQFFETAAKMQNSNDQLKAQLDTEKQTETTLHSKITELTQEMSAQATSNKFQEEQMMDRISVKTAKLDKDEAILKRFRAQVQQMADAQKAPKKAPAKKAPAHASKAAATPKAKTSPKGAVAPASKAAVKSATSKAAHSPTSDRIVAAHRLAKANATLSSKAPKPVAKVTKGLRGSK
jgi:chromosome segregation ATPase